MSDHIPSLFGAVAARRPDAPAVLADSSLWTYRELDRASDGVAAGLAERGVAPGERVALYCPNGAEFVICYLAILKCGAVVVPINLLQSPPAVAFMLEDCGVTVLFQHVQVADAAAAACAQAPSVRLRIGIGLSDSDAVDAHLETMLEPAAVPLNVTDADAEAVILYTSGTTGRPKGAVLTHRNLATNARAVAEVLAFDPASDRVLVVLPMFHAFAGTVGILTPLLCGAALIPVTRFDPQAITKGVGDQGATIFLGVPSLYAVLLRLDDAAIARWRSVRLCISGGAALPQAILREFERRFGIPILEGDGPTECGPVSCVNPPAGPRKPGSVGPPIPGVAMRIADAEGLTLADGEHGEVCVRGPSVMRGYWNLPEETAASFHADPTGRWFRTGDLGYRDADGWFYLVDRIKDLIICNGMNVYPRVVEEALVRHPAVAEAAVVGEPHPVHGEIPVAHVTLLADQQTDAAALKDWCREQLGRHEVPRRIEVVTALPRNAAGKILKRELRRSGEIERGV
ncbi:MAG: AMP-binding protein [Gammaproteobacteria bacterium]|jgi:long-chain acyl-CoA synthetase|nr:AMP-binding protein [Gammaproteobacteria bacterium]